MGQAGHGEKTPNPRPGEAPPQKKTGGKNFGEEIQKRKKTKQARGKRRQRA